MAKKKQLTDGLEQEIGCFIVCLGVGILCIFVSIAVYIAG